VINPDIRLPKNPFPVLMAELGRKHVAAIGPAVLSPSGQLEDSVRKFPTPLSLGMKILGRGDGRYQFAIGDETFAADWIGGMPAERALYTYISYDAIEYSHTVHSCVGGSSLYPGPLPEGSFFLFLGNQMAIVNIEQIEDPCPYMLTYYWLKNPVSIPDPDGICVKGNPAPTNTPNPDTGRPECSNQISLN